MKEWMVMTVMAGIVFLCCMAMLRMSRSLDRTLAVSRIRIGAESHHLLLDLNPALECCRNTMPHTRLLKQCGSREQLLERLRKGRLDLVFLDGNEKTLLPKECDSIYLPNQMHAGTYLDEDPADEPVITDVMVAWNWQIRSEKRDRFLHLIEDEQCMMNYGYCDYPDQ